MKEWTEVERLVEQLIVSAPKFDGDLALVAQLGIAMESMRLAMIADSSANPCTWAGCDRLAHRDGRCLAHTPDA